MQYKWQNMFLFLLLFLTSAVTTSYAFLQMYIGRQVMDGNFRMVLITVTVSAALLFFNSILLYFRKNFQSHLIAKMNQAF